MGIKDITGGMVIKCNTEAEADQLIRYLHKQGYVWSDGKPLCKGEYTNTYYHKDLRCCYHTYMEAGSLRIAVDSPEYYKEKGKQITEFCDLVVAPPICRMLGVAIEEEWYVDIPGVPRSRRYRISADGQRQYYKEDVGWQNTADEGMLAYVLNHPECIRHNPLASLDSTVKLRELLNRYPDSPLLVLSPAMAESYDDSLFPVYIRQVYADSLTLYHGKWLNRENYEKVFRADMACLRHPEMTDQEFEEVFQRKLSDAAFSRYIVIEIE
ncbi:MAG: hypothetical protein LUE86_06875 [Clostridiales bacterium]|nr:hypothetical protein [Clostridiales bacterium]